MPAENVVRTAPAPKLPVSKIAWGVIIFAIFATMIHLSNSSSSTQGKEAAASQTQPKGPLKGRFELEPGEDSLHLAVGKGETYSFTHGTEIEIRCVFTDGTDKICPENPLVPEPILEQYVRNTSKDKNTLVTYVLVSPTK